MDFAVRFDASDIPLCCGAAPRPVSTELQDHVVCFVGVRDRGYRRGGIHSRESAGKLGVVDCFSDSGVGAVAVVAVVSTRMLVGVQSQERASLEDLNFVRPYIFDLRYNPSKLCGPEIPATKLFRDFIVHHLCF